MYYYKARYYHVQLGRFLSTDPIGYDDQMNLYAYVGNSPVMYRDPLGMWSLQVGGLISGGAGVGGAYESGFYIVVDGMDINFGTYSTVTVSGGSTAGGEVGIIVGYSGDITDESELSGYSGGWNAGADLTLVDVGGGQEYTESGATITNVSLTAGPDVSGTVLVFGEGVANTTKIQSKK